MLRHETHGKFLKSVNVLFHISLCFVVNSAQSSLLLLTTVVPNIILTDHNKDLSRQRCKIQELQGLELGPIKFKADQDFQGPIPTVFTISKQRILETGDHFPKLKSS